MSGPEITSARYLPNRPTPFSQNRTPEFIKRRLERVHAQPQPQPQPLERPNRCFYVTFKKRELLHSFTILLLLVVSILGIPAPDYQRYKRKVAIFVLTGIITSSYIWKVIREWKVDHAFFWRHKENNAFYEKFISQVLGAIFISLSIATALKSLSTKDTNKIYGFAVGSLVSGFFYGVSQIIHADKDPAALSRIEVQGGGEQRERDVYHRMRTTRAYPQRGHLQLLENDPDHLRPYYV